MDFDCLGFLYGVTGEAARIWFNRASFFHLRFLLFDRKLQVLDSIYVSAPLLGLTRNVTNNTMLRMLYESSHSATLRLKFT